MLNVLVQCPMQPNSPLFRAKCTHLSNKRIFTLDRRQDSELRDAISSLRSRLTGNKDRANVYAETLNTACRVSSSPIGFIATRDLREGELQLRISHIYNLAECDAARDHTSSDNALDLPAQRKLSLCNKAQLLPAHETVHFTAAFPQLGDLKQVLAIPIADANSSLGVLCLANCQTPYHTLLAKRFWPLMANCTCMLRMMEHKDITELTAEIQQDNENWHELYHQFETVCPLSVAALDPSLNIIRVNPQLEAIFGYTSEQLVGQPVSKLLPERFPAEHKTQTFAPLGLATVNPEKIRIEGLTSTGDRVMLEAQVIQHKKNNKPHYVVLMRDSTEIEDVRAQHQAQIQRFRAVADLAPMGILQTDANWAGTYANDRWCEISGRSMENVLGMGWLAALDGEHFHKVIPELREAISNTLEYKGECLFTKPSGENAWVELHARPQIDSNGDINGFIATIVDSTFRHEAEEKLRNLAEHDPLTGLANRTMFQQRLEHSLLRIHRHGSAALLCLDLDGFKNINDTLGHDCGDQLLIEVADRLKTCVREEDTVARVGGDEFMILLEGLREARIAADVSEKVLKALEPPSSISHQEVFISTSIGITFAVEGDKNSAKSLMKQADLALYRAKHEGRNNYQYYSPELERVSQERLYLGNSLHHALRRTEFEVHYQIKSCVMTDAIRGFEAVLRWQHPRRGQLQPDQFIPILDESGLIVPVSRWLTFTCFMQHSKWIKQGLIAKDAKIAVNVSPRLLRDPTFITGLTNSIHDTSILPSNVIIEITETALLEHSAQTTEALNDLKKLGVAISLDDFGTGFSSLTHLKHYPIDQIKIDRSFIQNVLNDSGDKAIVEAVIVLARSLELSIVAEGVEDAATLSYLKELGCDEYQGFYRNKPQRAIEVEKRLAHSLELQTASRK